MCIGLKSHVASKTESGFYTYSEERLLLLAVSGTHFHRSVSSLDSGKLSLCNSKVLLDCWIAGDKEDGLCAHEAQTIEHSCE
jgi:hypothetical protein